MTTRRVQSTMIAETRTFRPFAHCKETETLYKVTRPRIVSTCGNRAPIWESVTIGWIPA